MFLEPVRGLHYFYKKNGKRDKEGKISTVNNPSLISENDRMLNFLTKILPQIPTPHHIQKARETAILECTSELLLMGGRKGS